MSISVLIAEVQQLLRQTLKLALESAGDKQVVGETSDGREAVALARSLKPDVVLLDIGLPSLNGMEACRQIIAERPKTKVIALTVRSDQRYVTGMLEAGAKGFLVKHCTLEDLNSAVDRVTSGLTYLDPETTRLVVDGFLTPSQIGENSVLASATPREREVIQLIAEGKTTGEIADQLCLSGKTVECHRRNLMQKLELRNIADITRFALREGLVKMDN